MTKGRTDVRRILLALTEASSIPDLWRAVTEHLVDQETEVVTVFFSDDRWHRAASLPFTREIIRISGSSVEFTTTRAQQLDKEAVANIRSRLQQIAAEAKISLAFEILSEGQILRIHELLTSESDVLIAPSSLRGRPIYNEIVRLKCRIQFVETAEPSAGS